MLIIRLSRTGKKHLPSYRLVVADKKRAVQGKFIDIVGTYNPVSKPKQFTADKEKILGYVKNGAQFSTTALNLLCDNGVLPKNRKIKIIHARKKTEELKTEEPKNESKNEEVVDKDKVSEQVEAVSLDAPAEETKIEESKSEPSEDTHE